MVSSVVDLTVVRSTRAVVGGSCHLLIMLAVGVLVGPLFLLLDGCVFTDALSVADNGDGKVIVTTEIPCRSG